MSRQTNSNTFHNITMAENEHIADCGQVLKNIMQQHWPEEEFSEDSRYSQKLKKILEDYESLQNEKKSLLEEITAYNQIAAEEAAGLRESKSLYESNYAASLATLSKWREESDDKKLSENEIMTSLDRLKVMAESHGKGIIDPSDLYILIRGLRYDSDIEKALTEGEIKGRNSKIEEYLKKSDRPGDRFPRFHGKNISAERPDESALGVLSRFGASSSDIWERGKAKCR